MAKNYHPLLQIVNKNYLQFAHSTTEATRLRAPSRRPRTRLATLVTGAAVAQAQAAGVALTSLTLTSLTSTTLTGSTTTKERRSARVARRTTFTVLGAQAAHSGALAAAGLTATGAGA